MYNEHGVGRAPPAAGRVLNLLRAAGQTFSQVRRKVHEAIGSCPGNLVGCLGAEHPTNGTNATETVKAVGASYSSNDGDALVSRDEKTPVLGP